MNTAAQQTAPFAVNQTVRLTKTTPMSAFRLGDEVTISRLNLLDGRWFIFARGPVHSGYVPVDGIEAV